MTFSRPSSARLRPCRKVSSMAVGSSPASSSTLTRWTAEKVPSGSSSVSLSLSGGGASRRDFIALRAADMRAHTSLATSVNAPATSTAFLGCPSAAVVLSVRPRKTSHRRWVRTADSKSPLSKYLLSTCGRFLRSCSFCSTFSTPTSSCIFSGLPASVALSRVLHWLMELIRCVSRDISLSIDSMLAFMDLMVSVAVMNLL
mmetsp:Transcript_32789/g.94660  ORF Transcript_32789/g.94660 Transcript_32789/m.94660 type:complete len:201 (-) Transcript_32789:514-1116(-)